MPPATDMRSRGQRESEPNLQVNCKMKRKRASFLAENAERAARRKRSDRLPNAGATEESTVSVTRITGRQLDVDNRDRDSQGDIQTQVERSANGSLTENVYRLDMESEDTATRLELTTKTSIINLSVERGEIRSLTVENRNSGPDDQVHDAQRGGRERQGHGNDHGLDAGGIDESDVADYEGNDEILQEAQEVQPVTQAERQESVEHDPGADQAARARVARTHPYSSLSRSRVPKRFVRDNAALASVLLYNYKQRAKIPPLPGYDTEDILNRLLLTAARWYTAYLSRLNVEALIAAVLPRRLDHHDPEVEDFMKYCRNRVKSWMDSWRAQAIDYARKWLLSWTQIPKNEIYKDCSNFAHLYEAIDKAYTERYAPDIFRWIGPYIDLNETTSNGKDWLRYMFVQLVTVVRLTDLDQSLITYNEREKNCLRAFDTLGSTSQYRHISHEDFPLLRLAGDKSRGDPVVLDDSDLDPSGYFSS